MTKFPTILQDIMVGIQERGGISPRELVEAQQTYREAFEKVLKGRGVSLWQIRSSGQRVILEAKGGAGDKLELPSSLQALVNRVLELDPLLPDANDRNGDTRFPVVSICLWEDGATISVEPDLPYFQRLKFLDGRNFFILGGKSKRALHPKLIFDIKRPSCSIEVGELTAENKLWEHQKLKEERLSLEELKALTSLIPSLDERPKSQIVITRISGA